MTVPRPIPDEVTPDWGEDVIYSEPVCDVDNVHCQGSADDSPEAEARKLRIEAAGRRFLDGHVPFLLSASLRGPFDEKSGWVNPWRSKQRPTTSEIISQIPTAAPRALNESVTQAQRGLISDSLECHLPSPESLKQATVTDTHPYLEEDELAMVQSWRMSTHVQLLSQDSFWAPAQSPLDASTKKRRAKESEWLRKVANKRRRPDSSDPSFSKSPRGKRKLGSRTSPIGNEFPRPLVASSHNSAAQTPCRASEVSKRLKSKVHEDDDSEQEDELLTSTPASFGSGHTLHASTPKRTSPRRDVWKHAIMQTIDSEDELGQKEAAAATLSSPISQRHQGQQSGILNPTAIKSEPSDHVKTRTLPRHEDQMKNQNNISQESDQIDVNEEHKEVMHKPDRPTATAKLVTQQDDSFCFKMRIPSDTHAEKQDADGSSPVTPSQPEEKLSSEFTGSPNPPSAEPSPSAHVVDTTHVASSARVAENISIHGVVEEDDGSLNPKEARKNEATDQPNLQITVKQPTDDTRFQAQPICDRTKINHDDNSPAVTEAEAGLTTSSTSQMDASQRTNHGCLDPTLEIDPQCGIDCAAAALDNAAISTEICLATSGVADPGTAEQSDTEQSDQNISSFPGAMGNESSTALPEEETQPIIAATGSDDYANTETGDDVPLKEFANKDQNEFSFKSILNRLVPSSPWTKLSKLTARSTSSPAPVAENDGAADEDLIDTCCDFEASDDVKEKVAASFHSKQSLETELNNSISIGPTEAEVVQALKPNSSSESATRIDELNQGDASEEIVSMDALETTDSALWQSTPSYIRIADSQQSPWARTGMTQQVDLPAGDVHTPVTQVFLPNDTQSCDESQRAIPHEAQSPWVGGTGVVVDAALETARAPHEARCNAEADSEAHQHEISQPEPRPSTPEPRFAFKTFASFMSPSPDRNRPKPGNRLSQGRHASAMKDSGSGSRPNLRVSWAEMPSTHDDDIQTQPFERRESPTPTSRGMSRRGSPPPATPIGDLPTSQDAKFNKHFAAVASRTDGLRQKLIPTFSQQVAQSPGLFGMAEKFLAADEMDTGKQVGESETDGHEKENRESQEPMDMVEDVFREMGDLLQVWDVDAELNQARKRTESGAHQVSILSQSPW